jgi:hypothetical protein
MTSWLRVGEAVDLIVRQGLMDVRSLGDSDVTAS